ncbi:MAG: type 1 secretion system HlyD family membrane fusion component [Phormidesmis priestleyi Ana]|uniref:Type 1 secretion system HlyD family membrane fusion component n=1 Tax=Phormidesmis priestleyi Ana TaxID=1666911 RepID=A0A0P7YW22_9CYAN|nr:MAG: type 1 secretion system HlyD family membrane fusion component [Phormidesmis priestleyi Ana]
MRLPFSGRFKRPLPWFLALGFLGIVAAVGIAFSLSRRGPQYDINELTVPVTADELTVRITASGSVEPLRTVNLSPKTSGTLESLLVEQGDRVTQGQLIARMDSTQIDAQLAQNRASVAEAQAQLDDTLNGASSTDIRQAEAAVAAAAAQLTDARARQTLAADDLSRNQRLYNQGAISRSDLDRAINENRSATSGVNQAIAGVNEAEQRLIDQQDGNNAETIAQAQARLDRAIGQLQSIEVQLADTEIRAPFDGIVTQRFAEEGAFVTPTATASDVTSATSTAIVAIASGLEVIAEVPEADISRIQVGQTVEIQADAFPNQTFEGRVRLIAPEAIERQNVTVFQVRVQLLSGTDQLRSNMTTTVSFIGDRLENALVVPTVSIITQSGESGVLVPGENGQAQFEPVVLGSQVGEQIQIIEGLEAGDRVFIDLPPGQSLENLTFGR